MKNSRRFLALMLAFLLAFGNLSTVAMAAEGEGAGIQQTEPVSAEAPAPEAPPADAGTEAVPTEPVLEQAPAEPAQNAQPAEETQPSETPAEVPAEASSPEEAPASGAADAEMNEYSSAEAAPETEQPAAEPGVGGFKLPGVEVPEAPETEIVAPEPQADPSTNADNGIMPIASNYDMDLNLKVVDQQPEYEVGSKITFELTVKNTRWFLQSHIWKLTLTVSGLADRGNIESVNIESPNNIDWHYDNNGVWSYDEGAGKGLPYNQTATITFTYTVTEADVEKAGDGGNLTVLVNATTGGGDTLDADTHVDVALKKTALNVVITPEKAEYTYNGEQRTASGFTYEVQGAKVPNPENLVTVTWKTPKTVSGTDAGPYTQDVTVDDFNVSVKNDKVYKLADNGVSVDGDLSLTINKANVTITGPMLSMTYGDEKPAIGSAVIDGLVEPDKGEGLKVSVAGPDNYDAGVHPLAVTCDANKNYNVTTKTDGSLTVNKREITVKVKPAADVYVGDESPVNVVLDGKPENLVNGHNALLLTEEAIVDTATAGDKPVSDMQVRIEDAGKNDVTSNYDVTYEGSVTVKALHTVTYEATGKDDYSAPEAVQVKDGPYTVESVPETVYIEDDYGNTIETWTFDGWKLNGEVVKEIEVTEDVTLTGEWNKIETPAPKHMVQYNFAGLPEKSTLNAQDTAKYPVAPEAEEYTKGQGFTVDFTEFVKDETTFNVTDNYGNLLAVYTFKGWTPESGTMGEEDIVVTGTWALTKEIKDPTIYNHIVSYKLDGNFPEGAELPEEATYTQGEKYTVADAPAPVEDRDGYGNLIGSWNFEGWFTEDGSPVEAGSAQTMGDADVEYTGKWTYEAQPVESYTGSVKVKYYFEDELFHDDYGPGFPSSLSGVFGATVTLTPNSPVDYNGEHYVLDENEGTYTAVVPKEGQPEAVIEVHYLLDSDNDGTADKYETNVITVSVTNGTADPTAGEHKAEFGKDFEITFTPDPGFVLGTVTVLGVEGAELTQNADGTYSYTFKNVTKDESISVVFVRETKAYKLNLGLDAINLSSDKLPDDFELNYTITAPDGTEVTGTVSKADGTYKSVTVRDNPRCTHKDAEYTWKDVAVELPVMPDMSSDYTIAFGPVNYETVEKAFYHQPTESTLTATFTLGDPEAAIDVKHVEIVYGTAVLHFDANADGNTVTNMPGDVYAYTSGQFAYADIPNVLPQREGYIFLGWTEKSTNNVNRSYTWTLSTASGRYQFNTNNARTLKSAKLYAVWAKAETVTVTKTFVGLEAAPEGFGMTYKANADGTFYSAEGSLSIADATTGEDEDGNTTYSWTLTMPGETTSNVTKTASMNFSVAETGYEVEGYEWSSNETDYKWDSVVNASWNLQPFHYNDSALMINTYVKQFTVKYFDTRDADKPSRTVTVAENGVAEKYIPERERFNFKGWATERDGGVVYGPGAEIVVESDINLYAVWAYDQVFYGIVDGLNIEQVKSGAFTLSRNIKLADGTLIKFDKNDLDAAFDFDGTTTTIKWTVELPETAIGTKPTIAATDLHHTGYYQSDYNKVWNGLQGVDGGMPAPGASDVGLIYVRVRGTTSYQKAEGGTINVNLSKWDNSSNLGLSTGSTSLTEYWRACEGPVGATAVADPGYVFKGWHKYYSNRIGDLVTPDPALTADNMKVNSATGLVETNQRFVPVFEKVSATMTVTGGSWEYDYTTHYPTVTFDNEDVAEFYKVQYSADGTTWVDDPIGIMHVAEGPKTVYVKAVDTRDNTELEQQSVTLTVTPHKVTLKSKTEQFYYTPYAHSSPSMERGFGNEQFYEIGTSPYNHVTSFPTSSSVTDVAEGEVENAFYVSFNSNPKIDPQDYVVTTEYGKLSVLPRTVTVTKSAMVEEGQIYTYTEKGTSSYKSSKDLYNNEVLTVTIDTTGLEPGVHTFTLGSEGLTAGVVKADGSTDSTKNYVLNLTFTITVVGMMAEDQSWEYDYQVHYPDVTFAGVDPAAAGLTVQYSEENGQWTDEPIGIMHVAEGPKTVQVQAVDASGNVVCEAKEVTLTVTPHPVTLKSNNATFYYTSNKKSERSMVKGFDDNDQFFELIGKSYGVIGFTSKEYADVGFYEDAGTFTVGWYPDQPGGRPGVYESDYTVTTEFGDLTILPRQVTVNETLEVPYTGETQSLVVDITGTTYDKGAYKPAKDIYHDEKLSATLSALEPGIYTVKGVDDKAVISGEGAEFSYKILKADGETDSTGNYDITFDLTLIIVDAKQGVTMNDWTYGETPEEPVPRAPDFEGYGEPTYAYFDAEGNELSGKPVNAGEYTVKATWTGDGLPELTEEADFTINKASVTIKPVDESKVYDGEELTASEYEFVGDGRFYGDDAGNYEFTYGGSQTEKGESVSTVTATLKDGAPDNYAIETQPGKLTITPKGYDPKAGEITVSKPVDVVYNGQSQELEPEVTDGDKELVLGADYTLSYSGDTTNAGTVTVTVTFTGNYSGTATTTYKITVRDLSYIYITTSVYNGQEQRAEAKTDEGLAYSKLLGEEPLVEGHKFTYLNGEKFYVTGTSARQHNRSTNAPWKSNGIENFTIVDENGTDVSRNYNLKAMQTRLEITKAPLTVRAVDNSKVYGTDDPNLTYEVMEGTTLYDRDVVNGYITFAVTREKGENVGEYNMTVSYEYPNAAKVKESNYTVTCLSGTFEITPAPLTVTTYSASKVYDGRELTAGGEIKGLVDEADAILNVTGTQTDAGSSYNTYEVTFADEQMAKNYKLEVANVGTLVVAPSSIDPADPTQPPVPSEPGPVDPNGPEPKDPTPVWMGAGVDVPENVEYDGAEHQWAPTVRDQYGNVMVAGTDYEVGYSTNDFTNVTGEITVTITGKGNYGGTVTRTYEITPMAVVIPVAGHSATLQYNGATQQVEGFDASSDAILEQDRADVQVVLAEGVNALASARNVSESPVGMGLAVDSFRLTGGKAANYSATFAVTDGSITITPRVVTLTADSASREYNGEPLTASGYTRTGDEFVAGEEPTVTVTGSQLIPGSSANVLTYGFGAGVESANYTVNAVNGTLTVTDRTEKYAIGMQPIGGTATYDGAPHSAGGFAAQSFTVEGKTYTVEGVNAGVTATNAGTYPVQITGEPIVRDAEGNDVTKQFNVTYGSASLVIGRKAVTVTANNAGKVYGTNDPASFTAAVTGLVGSDRLNYSVTREAGENVGTYAIIPGGAAVQGNYDVTYVNGAFTITSQAITGLTVNGPANVVYDGAAHQWAPTVTGANGAVLQAGRDYNVAYNTGNFTDAGTVNVTITGTGNYSGSVTRTYQITPRAVTLTSATATKVYDGAALTAGNVTAEGFVPGEGAAFNVTGGRTIVGTSLNTFTYTLNANTNAANYVIGQTFGTLTVTPAALAVNVPANIVYDGAAHQWAPTVTGVNGAVLQAGRDYNVAYGTGNFTDAGTVNVTVTGAGNYTGTVTRAYTITPRAVTMTSASATKVYDGTALTAGNVTAQGFAPGEGATYNVTGGRTIVGTSLNTFTYTLNANTDADNYNISRTFGTLTVTPAALTVNVPANTVYDGAAHQWAPTVTGANGAALQAGRDYNVAYSTGNFTDAGTVNVTITGAGNYTGTVTRTYTITPRDVTLTSASATKVYDGTALTAGNVTAQGFAPGEGATYNVTGRRTIVGTSLNAFTYTLNANTDAGNYNISRVFGRLVVTQAEGPAPDEGPNGPGNGPDNGPGNGPDNGPGNDVNPDNEANTADITEDEVPLGGEPEIEAASEDIPEDDVPMGALPDKEQEYSLSEEVVISEDETPLGAAPTEADCCILHFILMLCALGVAVYYTYDRKRHQKREFELRSELK